MEYGGFTAQPPRKNRGAEATHAHKLQIEMDELQWKALSATPRPKQPGNEERAALQKAPGELPSDLLNGLLSDNGVTRSQRPRPNSFVQLQIGSGRNSKTPHEF